VESLSTANNSLQLCLRIGLYGRGGREPAARQLDVNATVIDVNGRRVASLVRNRLGPGRHDVHWNPGRPGVYFVRMEADGKRLTQRLQVLK